MMKQLTGAILLFSMMLLSACQEEYQPVNPPGGPKYVVEGYVEAGEKPFPPYVLLTRTFDFNGDLDPGDFNSSFVHDADVRVNNGQQVVQFTEICLSDLSPEIRAQVAQQFGFNPDSLYIDFCVYADLLNQLKPKIGGRYDLEIHVGSDVITATTTIPFMFLWILFISHLHRVNQMIRLPNFALAYLILLVCEIFTDILDPPITGVSILHFPVWKKICFLTEKVLNFN